MQVVHISKTSQHWNDIQWTSRETPANLFNVIELTDRDVIITS